MLTIFEELYLFTLYDDREKKTSIKIEKLPYGLGGAILAEMVLLGKVQLNQKNRLEVVDGAEIGDDILDKALQELQESEKPRKVTYWIEALSEKSEKLQKRLFERMVEKGVFLVEEDERLWAVPSHVYPDNNASAKYCMKERLRRITLADGTGDLLFTRDERREANRNIHEMLVTEALKDPTAQAIEEIHNAVDSE
jgi:Golgi phosphoprotein 3